MDRVVDEMSEALKAAASRIRKVARDRSIMHRTRIELLEVAHAIEAALQQPAIDFNLPVPASDSGRSQAAARRREQMLDHGDGIKKVHDFVLSCGIMGAACFEVEAALGSLHQSASSDLWSLTKKGALVKVEDWLKDNGYSEAVQRRYRKWNPNTRMWVGVWVASSLWLAPERE
jgi:hypothetical protein